MSVSLPTLSNPSSYSLDICLRSSQMTSRWQHYISVDNVVYHDLIFLNEIATLAISNDTDLWFWLRVYYDWRLADAPLSCRRWKLLG